METYRKTRRMVSRPGQVVMRGANQNSDVLTKDSQVSPERTVVTRTSWFGSFWSHLPAWPRLPSQPLRESSRGVITRLLGEGR